MRIESINDTSLLRVSNKDLYRLQLQFRQLRKRYGDLESSDGQFLEIHWAVMKQKYEILDQEFKKRELPETGWRWDQYGKHPESIKASGNKLPGIYLVAPHGKWIWEEKKNLIIKKKKFAGMAGKPLILVSGSMAYGVIRLKIPSRIDLMDFARLRDEHLITDNEREKWWPEGDELFAYEFDVISRYEKPRLVKVPQGVQTFIENVEFSKAIDWGLVKPSYRIFELEDLKNTPGLQTGKIVIEAKFDGVRTAVIKKDGEITITTDPEETATPNKTKRLPWQVKELEKLAGDFKMDAELVMIKDGQVLHRTATNALINGKFDPTEQSKMAHLYIFDIIESEGKTTKIFPLKERKELLSRFKDSEHVHFVRSSTTFTKPSLSYVVDVNAAANVKKAFDTIMAYAHKGGPFPKGIAEGVMIKKLESPYSGKTWAKLKEEFEVDALVVGKKPVKGSPNVFNYQLSVGPLTKEWAEAIRKVNKRAVVDYIGKSYNLTGWSDNSKQKVAIGKILRISAEDINRFETDSPEYPYYKTYIARVKQPVPEKSSPDGMAVLERLSELTPPRERLAKSAKQDAAASIKAGKIPADTYEAYARDNQPLPSPFYVSYKEGTAFAQTHIRGLDPGDVDFYKAKKITLAELFENHSIHIDLRMRLGQEKLIQWVILESDFPSYLRYLRGELRETAGGVMNVQHALSVVKPSAEEPQKLGKEGEEDKELILSPKAAKNLADLQIINRSYFIPPGGVGATPNKYAWMGLIWEGRVKSGIQRKDFHEYFLYPVGALPEKNRKFFDGRFVWKCLKREKDGARWETWEAVRNPKPADPVEHKDGGYYFPVKAGEVKAFGRENYEYGKKEPK